MKQKVLWRGLLIGLLASGGIYSVACSNDYENGDITLESSSSGNQGGSGTGGGGAGGTGSCDCEDRLPCAVSQCSNDTTEPCIYVTVAEMVGQTCEGNKKCSASGHCVDPCTQDTDCPPMGTAKVYCYAGQCFTCSDGKNGDEQGPDCGNSACGKCNGTQCTEGMTHCASGHCVDEYCCESDCAGPCNACNIVAGACTPLEKYAAGEPKCGTGKGCDGEGACAVNDTHSCKANSDCISDQCKCGVLWPYMCDGDTTGECKRKLGESCDNDTQCILEKCEDLDLDGSKECTKLPGNASCTSGEECRSGTCNSGNEECTGP